MAANLNPVPSEVLKVEVKLPEALSDVAEAMLWKIFLLASRASSLPPCIKPAPYRAPSYPTDTSDVITTGLKEVYF